MFLRVAIVALLVTSGVSCALRGPGSFRKADPVDRLTELMESEDDSTALQAAWNLANLPAAADDASATPPTEPQRLASFLDFFEQRTHAAPPEWFRRRIVGDEGDAPAVPPVATARQEAHALIIQSDRDSIVVPGDLEQKCKSATKLAACFTPTLCYVAADCEYTGGYDVFCIDRTTGRTVWSSKARGCWSTTQRGEWDLRVPFAQLISFDDCLVVFGQSQNGFVYAHGLRTDDGKPLFHFCNYRQVPMTLQESASRSNSSAPLHE